jgi:6-pyruvoyltetrahydropterin/6-carboxytetrahydropterin synthase
MIIRKLFTFENAHIVRGCTTQRCSHNIHGHSYTIEILLESNYLDNGQMVYDFGLVKHTMKSIIDSFDHSIALWAGDEQRYIDDMQYHSDRWVLLPVSPSAEQFSRVFYLIIEKILKATSMSNGEREVKLNSVIVHETKSGYAQCFEKDAHSALMGEIDLKEIEFSKQVISEWGDANLWDKILFNGLTVNPLKI